MSSIDNGHVENNSYISIDYKIVQIGFAIRNSLNGNTKEVIIKTFLGLEEVVIEPNRILLILQNCTFFKLHE